jgi:hypothetical protein
VQRAQHDVNRAGAHELRPNRARVHTRDAGEWAAPPVTFMTTERVRHGACIPVKTTPPPRAPRPQSAASLTPLTGQSHLLVRDIVAVSGYQHPQHPAPHLLDAVS